MLQRIRNRKGFTLVELMIVVAIIGILAAIAIPNFLNFRLKAKTSEAKSNLGAIRSTEVAYVAENDEYVAGQPTTPVDRGSVANPQDKKPWVSTTRFSILGFAPEGEVFFSYLIQDGTGADPLWPTAVEGFVAQAIGDLDGDGQLSDFTVTNTSTEVTKGGAPF